MPRSQPLPNNVCIVTPEFPGPMFGGGGATAVYWQARALQESGVDVTVFCLGDVTIGNSAAWRKKFKDEIGIEVIFAADWMASHRKKLFSQKNNKYPHLMRSLWVLEFLEDRYFPVVYLQDILGHGLRALQAKKAGLGFERTKFIVTLHGSIEWALENLGMFTPGVDVLVSEHMERECVKLADHVIAPTAYMKNWVSERWGVDARKITVLANCFEEGQKGPAVMKHGPFNHLVFFGRLETRKGLEIFTEAVMSSSLLSKKVRSVTYLGNSGQASGTSGRAWIEETTKQKTPFKIQILDQLETFQAWNWLKNQKGILVVAPSTMDNLPYAVMELFLRRIPFVSTQVGGIPEIIGNNPQALAPATVKGIREHLEQIVGKGKLQIRYNTGVQPETVHKLTAEFYRKVQSVALAVAPSKGRTSKTKKTGPVVSVIIPQADTLDSLRRTLESLKEQDCSFKYEVIVTGDTSRSLPMGEGLRNLAYEYKKDPRYKFLQPKIRTDFHGIYDAYNFASAKACGDYLVFLRPDIEALPVMLEMYRTAMNHAGCAAMTCLGENMAWNGTERTNGSEDNNIRLISPLGSAVEAGLFENIYVEGSFIVRREVFKKAGGFSVESGAFREYPLGDWGWDFFAKLTFSGAEIGVVPKVLYRRRDYPIDQKADNRNYFRNRSVILARYATPEARARVDWLRILGLFEANNRNIEAYHYFAGLPDEKLLQAIGRKPGTIYDAMVTQMRRTLQPCLKEWSLTRPRVFVYGAGLHTRVLLGVVPELAEHVVGIIDRGAGDAKFLGWKCIKPENLNPEDCDVVLYSSREHELKMYENLSRHTLSHVLIYNKLPAKAR